MTQPTRILWFAVLAGTVLSLVPTYLRAQAPTTVSINPPSAITQAQDCSALTGCDPEVLHAKGSGSGDCNAVTSDTASAHSEALACDVSGVTARNSSRFGTATAFAVIPFSVDAAGGTCVANNCTVDISMKASAQAQPGDPGDAFGGYASWAVTLGARSVPFLFFIDPNSGEYTGVQDLGGVVGAGPWADTFGLALHLWAGGESADSNGTVSSFFHEFDYSFYDHAIVNTDQEVAGLGDQLITAEKVVVAANTQYFLMVTATAGLGRNAPGLAIVDPVLTVDPSNPDAVLHIDAPVSNGQGILSADEAAALAAEGFDLNRLARVGITPSANKPTITTTAITTPGPNSSGWNNTNVSVSLNATESGGPGVQAINFTFSGAQTGTGSLPGANGTIPITAEGMTTVTYFAQDSAGNREATKTIIVRIDKTPPTITTTRTPLPNASGWNNTNVTVSFQCSDSLSGLAAGSPPAPTTLSAEGANQSVTGTCQDMAGNSASTTVNGINIDKTPPVVTASANPSTLWPPNGRMVNVTVSGTMTDNLSGVNPNGATVAVMDSYGLVQPSGNVAVGANGSYSFTVMLEARRDGQDQAGRLYGIIVTAQDNAGNQSSAATTVVVPHDQGQ